MNGNKTEHWFQNISAKIDTLQQCVFCDSPKELSQKANMSESFEACTIQLHNIRGLGLNLHEHDLVCFNCMNALETYVIPNMAVQAVDQEACLKQIRFASEYPPFSADIRHFEFSRGYPRDHGGDWSIGTQRISVGEGCSP